MRWCTWCKPLLWHRWCVGGPAGGRCGGRRARLLSSSMRSTSGRAAQYSRRSKITNSLAHDFSIWVSHHIPRGSSWYFWKTQATYPYPSRFGSLKVLVRMAVIVEVMLLTKVCAYCKRDNKYLRCISSDESDVEFAVRHTIAAVITQSSRPQFPPNHGRRATTRRM